MLERDIVPYCVKFINAKFYESDIVYVRETWQKSLAGTYLYKTDNNGNRSNGHVTRWKPSIHMPKEAARIFLRVTDVKIERLQDITEEQAMQEGIEKMSTPNISGVGETFIQGFGELWNSTIKKSELDKYGWHANPYVFVYRFNVISKAEAIKESEGE